jgi:hypothetical protein
VVDVTDCDTNGLRQTPIPSAALSDVIGPSFSSDDTDAMPDIEAWASLSEQQREAILAIVRGSK